MICFFASFTLIRLWLLVVSLPDGSNYKISCWDFFCTLLSLVLELVAVRKSMVKIAPCVVQTWLVCQRSKIQLNPWTSLWLSPRYITQGVSQKMFTSTKLAYTIVQNIACIDMCMYIYIYIIHIHTIWTIWILRIYWYVYIYTYVYIYIYMPSIVMDHH